MQPINTGILSIGMSGTVFHAPFIATNPGFNFYAVWERTKNVAEERYPTVKTSRTLEELLGDRAIELVVVNTPNTTHYEYTKAALEAGKHVVVEKPFTVTVAEGEELIALAKETGKLLSVYHNRRYDSDYKAVKKIVDEGLLGDLSEVEIHYDRFKAELSYKTHKEIPIKGTGALYDLGSHLIDQALQLFGMPTALFADILIIRPGSQVDDYFEIILYYPQFRVRLKCNYLVREPLPAYILHGSKGSFIKAKTDMQETALLAGEIPGGVDWGKAPDTEMGLLHTEKDGEVIKEYIGSTNGNYDDYYKGIYEAIRNGKAVPVEAEDGLNVVRIIEAAFQSSEEKRVIDL
ncbi:MAG TPA: Gfo/Idh/MocA family oxidoreductase [Flavisolibacter sp.]|nr:Gfo/Idh/MocA family oxidoreductase [Flavisolibacter sp.]